MRPLSQNLSCSALACNTVWVSWARPERVGHPPLHKYKLERWHRLPGSPEAGRWETAHGDLDGDELGWQDEEVQVLPMRAGMLLHHPDRLCTCWRVHLHAASQAHQLHKPWQAAQWHAACPGWPGPGGPAPKAVALKAEVWLQKGEYIYRLSAWNAYGWSPHASSGSCFTDAKGLPCQPHKQRESGAHTWLVPAVQALGLAVLISTGMMQAARRSKAVRAAVLGVSHAPRLPTFLPQLQMWDLL